MTPILEKGVSEDPPGRPIVSFDHNITPYILFCLETVFKRVFGYRKIYCGIHLMIQGFLMTPFLNDPHLFELRPLPWDQMRKI